MHVYGLRPYSQLPEGRLLNGSIVRKTGGVRLTGNTPQCLSASYRLLSDFFRVFRAFLMAALEKPPELRTCQIR